MGTKPTKPNRQDDMRTKQGKERFISVPNRNKVVPPHDMPHPESMKPKKEATIDHHQHDNAQQ